VQHNQSCSVRRDSWPAFSVGPAHGEADARHNRHVFAVAVDIRKGSPRSASGRCELSPEQAPGLATADSRAASACSPTRRSSLFVQRDYNPATEVSVRGDDPDIGIDGRSARRSCLTRTAGAIARGVAGLDAAVTWLMRRRNRHGRCAAAPRRRDRRLRGALRRRHGPVIFARPSMGDRRLDWPGDVSRRPSDASICATRPHRLALAQGCNHSNAVNYRSSAASAARPRPARPRSSARRAAGRGHRRHKGGFVPFDGGCP